MPHGSDRAPAPDFRALFGSAPRRPRPDRGPDHRRGQRRLPARDHDQARGSSAASSSRSSRTTPTIRMRRAFPTWAPRWAASSRAARRGLAGGGLRGRTGEC